MYFLSVRFVKIESVYSISHPMIILDFTLSLPYLANGNNVIRIPNPSWSSSSSSPLSRFFLHQLQTSITQSFVKLEHFLRPFLKTRSHNRSAHTFRSSLWFLKVPQKWVLKNYFLTFLNHIFLHVWS